MHYLINFLFFLSLFLPKFSYLLVCWSLSLFFSLSSYQTSLLPWFLKKNNNFSLHTRLLFSFDPFFFFFFLPCLFLFPFIPNHHPKPTTKPLLDRASFIAWLKKKKNQTNRSHSQSRVCWWKLITWWRVGLWWLLDDGCGLICWWWLVAWWFWLC